MGSVGDRLFLFRTARRRCPVRGVPNRPDCPTDKSISILAVNALTGIVVERAIIRSVTARISRRVRRRKSPRLRPNGLGRQVRALQ